MKTYIYVETAEYLEQAIQSYEDIKRKTCDFTDLTNFKELSIDIIKYSFDSMTTRLIINGESYRVFKNFICVDINMQFIILHKGC